MSAFVIENASWELYELLRQDSERQGVRITYDDGSLLLARHETNGRIPRLIGRLIETASMECCIRISSFGGTTWKRRDLRKAIEADESYYVRHESKMRGKRTIDLTVDPAPDLAVDLATPGLPMDRLRVFGALGVGKVWQWEDWGIKLLRLQGELHYRRADCSEAMPFLNGETIERFVEMLIADETNGVRAFCDWLRSNSLCGNT